MSNPDMRPYHWLNDALARVEDALTRRPTTREFNLLIDPSYRNAWEKHFPTLFLYLEEHSTYPADDEMLDRIVSAYTEIAETGVRPAQRDLTGDPWRIGNSQIQRRFENMDGLHKYMAEKKGVVCTPKIAVVEVENEKIPATETLLRELVEEKYVAVVAEKGRKPTLTEMLWGDVTLTKTQINRLFGSLDDLHAFMKQNHGKELEKHYTSLDTVFSEKRSAKKNLGSRRYIITTAVADAKVHLPFMSALQSFASEKEAKIVVMPCESVTNSFENETASFDQYFNELDCFFVTEDTDIADRMKLCSIQVSAKQLKPITGLNRLGRRDGAFVFASPKQFLEYTPCGHDRNRNSAIMTPGACTRPNYYSDRFVSKRLSYIAEHDHTIGAIIVEIDDTGEAHFRQVQAAEDGSFADMGYRYHPDGKLPTYERFDVILGDLHGARVDQNALDIAFSVIPEGLTRNIFLHDVFDGYSISHHVQTIGEMAERVGKNAHVLETELEHTRVVLEAIEDAIDPEKIYIVKGNHDEHLERYLREGRYVSDPTNHKFALSIAPSLFEPEIDVLKFSMEKASGVVFGEKWEFLPRDASVVVGGVECAAHGDLGTNGARPSLTTFEKVYGNCVIGHNHTAAIQRGVFRVGTLSQMDMGYNRGPSSWTPTICLLYEDGTRQLINLYEGVDVFM